MTRAAVAGLQATHSDLRAVLHALNPSDWALPSACAGWRVHDVVAHITSNFKEMVEPTPVPATTSDATGPDTESAPAMGAEQAMEMLVAPRKGWTAEQLLAEYDRYADAAFATLSAMQDEPLASTPLDVADLGTYPMHLLANAYCFDHYCHLRHDLLGPGGPLADTISGTADTDADARLRPGIEWMWAGLPQMCRSAMQVVDRPFTVELTGAGGGSWTLHPASPDTGGLIRIADGGGAAATATSTAHDFVSWATGRSAWRDACTLAGDTDADTDYAARVLDAIDII